MAILRARPSLPNDLARQIDRLATKGRGVTRQGLQKASRKIKQRMIGERLSGRPGLKRGSGATARSVKSRVVGLATTLRIESRIGDRSTPGIRIHERGGTIRPKSAKRLAIPLVGRGGRGKKARPKVDFWIENEKGNIVGLQKVGEDGVRPVVVLVPSVIIPKRLGFFRIVNAETRRALREIRGQFRRGGK